MDVDGQSAHRGIAAGLGTSALLDAITEFRTTSSARALVEQAPEAIARLGFDRVLVSRIDNGIWVPESMFVRRDPQWAAAILQAGRDQPTTLKSVVETDVVDSGRTFVVDEVQTNPRVCRPIAVMSRSENYGVAPITVERTVIGMVHVDCYLQRRPVHREKCVTLAVAAESLAAQLSRLLLLEQLQAVQDTVGRSWSTTSTVVASNASGPGMKAHPELTPREVDVIRLMAAGESNHQIARRLMITVGTVKTHVSSILHKLNAANRAQAVSRWLSAHPT